ncbi:DNA replication complex subunit Gins51 [Natrialbaceae archaeon A-gly3]
MNLEELQTVQGKERQKDSLQHLRPSFYQDVGEYIADLEDERERAAGRANDPFSSPEVGRLTDEIETAKDVVEAIYERRMGKLVKQASLAAAGMPADDEGLTAEEEDLFTDLVDRIQSNKNRVLDVLEGEVPATEESEGTASSEPATGSDPTTPADPDSDAPPVPSREPSPIDDGAAEDRSPVSDGQGDEITAADVMGGDAPPTSGPSDAPGDSPAPPQESPPEAPESPSDGGDSRPPADTSTDASGDDEDADVDRITVRITQDVGPILGVDDREYTLEADDVVTLPEQNATPLVERDAAEPLE